MRSRSSPDLGFLSSTLLLTMPSKNTVMKPSGKCSSSNGQISLRGAGGTAKSWCRVYVEQLLANVCRLHRLVPMSCNAEAELLARCCKGEAEAWNELFDRHYAAAGRFVFQLGFDFTREDVEEICQEVFLTVIKSLHSFQGNCQFQTWLFRIALNRARDYRQRQNAAKRGGGQTPLSLDNVDPENGFTIDPPSSLPGPDAVLLNAEKLSLVGQALEQLGGPCQEIIELRYFGDLSYEELALELALNQKTVSSRLSKCLDKLEAITRTLFSQEKKTPTSV